MHLNTMYTESGKMYQVVFLHFFHLFLYANILWKTIFCHKEVENEEIK